MTRTTRHARTGVYWVRKGVPAPLRSVVGKRELTESLRTKDRVEAKRRAADVIAKFEAVIAAARSADQGQANPATTRHVAVAPAEQAGMPAGTMPQEPAKGGAVAGPVLTGLALLDAWSLEQQPSSATLKKYGAAFRQLAAIVGFDDISRLMPDDVVKFKEACLKQGRDPGTVQDDILACGAVCSWAVKNRRLASSPFQGLAPKPKRRGPAPRAPYSDEHARRILEASRQERGWLRWLPWILAFTGCRLSEAAELRLCDVREEICRKPGKTAQAIWVFDFVPLEVRAGKNSVFQRMVPVHPALQVEGFLDFVRTRADACHADRTAPLFGDLRVAADGTRTTTAQNQHGRWLKAIVGITDPAVAPAHSWRHRIQDELRKIRAHPEIIDAITGRHNPRNAGDGYGRGFRGMPDEVLDDLQRIPSPLSSPRASPSPEIALSPVEVLPQPRWVDDVQAAMQAWFERKVSAAYRLFADHSFASAVAPEDASDAELAEHHAHMTAEDASRRIEAVEIGYAETGVAAGRAAAEEIVGLMVRKKVPRGSLAFDIVAAWALLASKAIEQARIHWAEGDLVYRPDPPPVDGLTKRLPPGGDLYRSLSR
ncbi:DUF6538 domain-containing protein [Falsiroseomonas oryzae]|uniref:DUF6538 domain-containing protein n=1 Tax=Falsiroseomonas oryzae TaxID=2766473 RepID=UPI0022EB64E6|nr:DUF6538 domain-containing protein [Roseomonas sp. MO-31]